MKTLVLVACYVLALAVLLALNYALHRWNREDADEAARRDVERFRAFYRPGQRK